MNARKKMIYRLIISALFLIIGVFFKNINAYAGIACFIISYIIVGYNVILTALRHIRDGKLFDENFLMSVATIGAIIIGEYTEAVAVMLFYQVGELFQSYAVNKSRKSISDLMDIRPEYANVLRDGVLEQIDPDEVHIDEIITIKPGERVPLDCIVETGTSTLDTSALTGESLPREISIGAEVLSGTININGTITAKVTKLYEDSTVSKILDLVENASDKKSKAEHFITKFARYYTPIVVYAALALAFIPHFFTPENDFSMWVYRALSFLVVSCPCALVISIPLSFFGGIGCSSKKGILIKGSNYIEVLANTKHIIFDKTGTLTKGVFAVVEIHPVNIEKDDLSNEALLEYATYAEYYSNHPISKSLQNSYNKELDLDRIKNTEEIAGHGIVTTIDDHEVLVGNEKLMNTHNITITDRPSALGTIIFVAINQVYKGYILISDELKPDSIKAIKNLKSIGITDTYMLTGDAKAIGESIGSSLGIDHIYTELLPADKVSHAEDIMTHQDGPVAYVGDGINDAPVLARADIGIAMGALGSDAAIEAADIVIMTDEPSNIAIAVDISRRTIRIVKQNIFFALGIKIGVLILTAFGFANMWAAVFADVGVSVIAILNACRILTTKKYDK